MRSGKGLAWVSLGVSMFWQPRNPRVSLLVHVSPEILMGEVPKEQYADSYETSALRKSEFSRVYSLVLASPELLTCEVPKWLNIDGIWCFIVSAPRIPDSKLSYAHQSQKPGLRIPGMD